MVRTLSLFLILIFIGCEMNSKQIIKPDKFTYETVKFNDSSIDILIYCFASTNEWDKFLLIKENLALKIKKEVRELKLGFAFPSRTIYLENISK